LIWHGPHRKWRVQQSFYCWVCIRCRANVFIEPSPSKDRENKHTDTQTARWSHKAYIHLSTYGSTALCWTLAAFSVSWSFTQSVGLLERGINPSLGRYLHTGQHKHRINAHRHPRLKWESKPSQAKIPVFERAKTVHTLDRVANVTGKPTSKAAP
jgi:hypothetical protein